MYKVIVQFTDLKDGNHLYKVGDTFPREGAKANQARLDELASNKNKRGMALIEKIKEEKKEEKSETPKKSIAKKKTKK